MSIVFDDPPAPAAREEFGRATAVPAARRRVCAPGGLTTPLLVATRPFVFGESESDCEYHK